jgi:hypothetical protein
MLLFSFNTQVLSQMYQSSPHSATLFYKKTALHRTFCHKSVQKLYTPRSITAKKSCNSPLTAGIAGIIATRSVGLGSALILNRSLKSP